ncbi:MAG: PHB depolymerase family esterase [Bdellovibrionota bacterium]
MKLSLSGLTALVLLSACSVGTNANTELVSLDQAIRMASGGVTSDEAARGVRRANAFQGRQYRIGMLHARRLRTFLLYLPPQFATGGALPLVFNFHGAGGNSQQQSDMTLLRDKARREGFILVEPDGTPIRPLLLRRLGWNAGTCCGSPASRQIDDVGFVKKILSGFSSAHVNRSRVHGVGFSNGGMFTHRLGCELSDEFASIAVVAAVVADQEPGSSAKAYACNVKRSVPVLLINGEKDNCIPFAGGQASCLGSSHNLLSVEDALAFGRTTTIAVLTSLPLSR